MGQKKTKFHERMRVVMLLLLIQSSSSVKTTIEESELRFKNDVYDPETGQRLDDTMMAEDLEDRSGAATLARYPRGGLKASLYLAYNTPALQKYTKEKVGEKVNKVFEYIKTWFQEGTLGVKIYFTLAGHGHWPINPTLGDVSRIVKNVTAIIKKPATHIGLMTGGCWGYGKAYTGTLCSSPWSRVSFNCIDPNNDLFTARIIAHEIGHSFNLAHDFGGSTVCDSGKIMGYNYNPTGWSNCSRIYFSNYYNRHAGPFRKFCLMPNECNCNPKGSVGLKCTDDNYCTCKKGHLGPNCDQCWPYTKNLGTEEEPECGCIMENALIDGATLEVIIGVASFEACHQICVDSHHCLYFTYNLITKTCWLKGLEANRKWEFGPISGTKICANNAANIKDCWKRNTGYSGFGVSSEWCPTPEKCQISCQEKTDCDVWVWEYWNKRCLRKGMRSGFKSSEGYVSGPKNCFQIKPYNGPLKVCICFDKGSIGSGCPLKQSYCKSSCKPGFHGPTCGVCWPIVKNKGTASEPDCRGLILNTRLSGGDLENAFEASSINNCQQTCAGKPGCDYFMFNNSNKFCHLKGVKGWSQPSSGLISGLRYCEGNSSDCFSNGINYPMLKNVKEGKLNKRSTAELCQISCLDDMECEVWEWNPKTKECWLKNFLLLHAVEDRGSIVGFRNVQLQEDKVCGCYEKGSATGACDNSGDCFCEKGYEGSKCDICVEGYHKSEGYCIECECYQQGALNETCTSSGQCYCGEGYKGTKCEKCVDGYHNSSSSCQACGCDLDGSMNKKCNDVGQCFCKENHNGIKCETCMEGYIKHKGACVTCICYDNGSIGSGCPGKESYCESKCKPGFKGPTCAACWPRVQNKGTESEPDCRGLMLNTRLSGGNLEKAFEASSIIICQQACVGKPGCDYFLFNLNTKLCHVKGIKGWSRSANGLVAGPKYCEGNAKDCFVNGVDYSGLRNVNTGSSNLKATAVLCQISCIENILCEAFIWVPHNKHCWHKNFIEKHSKEDNGYITGFRDVKLQEDQVCGCHEKGSVIGECDSSGDCYCEKEYKGSKCDICVDGYHMSEGSCIECECYQQGALNETCTSSGQCHCKEGHTGTKCDKCEDGYYNSSGSCLPCGCDQHGSISKSCNGTGHCSCNENHNGMKCDTCVAGYFKPDNVCVKCGCNKKKSEDDNCDSSGQCNCKETYGGRTCDSCVDGYHEWKGSCKVCDCNIKGAHNRTCNNKGECHCKENYLGKKCTGCVNGNYKIDENTCEECGCHKKGASKENCKSNGECYCLKEYEGKKCDQCKNGYFLLPDETCQYCDCNKKGAHNTTCNDKGECPCKDTYKGDKCNECTDGHFLKGTKCLDCGCNEKGAEDMTCGSDGECKCKENYIGTKCKECKDGFFKIDADTCQECGCNKNGVDEMKCNSKGKCTCKDNHTGTKCDECVKGYFLLADNTCQACGCSKDGTQNKQSCDSDGKCPCKPMYDGDKCTDCKPGFIKKGEKCLNNKKRG